MLVHTYIYEGKKGLVGTLSDRPEEAIYTEEASRKSPEGQDKARGPRDIVYARAPPVADEWAPLFGTPVTRTSSLPRACGCVYTHGTTAINRLGLPVSAKAD